MSYPPSTFPLRAALWRYWLAMNASALQGAAHAGKAWLATAAAHAATDSVPALNFRQFLAVLGFAFAMEGLSWLDKNPLPTPPEPKSESTKGGGSPD
jgi:hypothetical protein